MAECSVCGGELNKETPQMNGKCIDCFAEKWGDIVDEHPMVSPCTLLRQNIIDNR